MHIFEGALSPEVCVVGYAITAVIAAVTIRKIRQQQIPKISVITAVIFVSSIISFPLLVSTVHLILNGVAGIFLKTAAFPAFMVAIFFQAVMFKHGGLSTYGANVIVMGVPALIAYAIFCLHKRQNSITVKLVLAFIAGFMAIVTSIFLFCLFLYFTENEFLPVLKAVAIAHIPIIVIESVMCVMLVQFILKVKPELLEN